MQAPKKVTILILPESSMMTLSSVLDPLRAANRLSRGPLFEWRLISLDGKHINLTCNVSIDVDDQLRGNERGELLFVVAGFNQSNHATPKMLPKIRSACSHFSTICSIEAGAWVLANAGVLRNDTVTTHWEDLENLAFAHPHLNVVNERFTIDGRIWSSGGASPTLDMMLHYLRVTQRPSLAIDVANVFIYSQGPGGAEPQSATSLNWLDRVEPRLAKAIHIMEENIEEPLPVPQVAARVNLSQKMLELISKQHLQLTPGAYYLRLRLQAARRLVLDTNNSILEVAVRTGFSSAPVLSRAFKTRYELSPQQLRLSARDLHQSNIIDSN